MGNGNILFTLSGWPMNVVWLEYGFGTRIYWSIRFKLSSVDYYLRIYYYSTFT